MTADEIKAKLGIDDARVELSDNGGWYWVHVARTHEGHRYSHSAKLDLHPSDEQIADVAEMFSIWWADTIKDQRV